MAAPGVSIALATLGRPAMLRETLASLGRAIENAAMPVEIVVITDPDDHETQQACRSSGLPLRLILEAKPGLSTARNRAIDDARHEIILFLDDDVDLGPGWLNAIVSPFRDSSVLVAGARVLPFGSPLPTWLPPAYDGLLSLFDRGNVPKQVPWVIGCCFAVRKEAFERFGRFDLRLGRQGKVMLAHEETEFMARLPAGAIWYAPSAVVYHKVGHRMNPRTLRRTARGLGKSQFLLDQIQTAHGQRVEPAPSVVRASLHGLAALGLLPSRARSIGYQIRFSHALGYWLARWRRA